MKQIPEFPNYYLTEDGRLFSDRRGTLKERKKPLAKNGYVLVGLRRDGKTHMRYLHRLMLETFVGPSEGRVTRHLDDNPLNNSITNLAWGTQADNMNDVVVGQGHHYSKRSCCKQGHEYTEENTRWRVTKSGSRFRECVTCSRSRAQRQRDERTMCIVGP